MQASETCCTRQANDEPPLFPLADDTQAVGYIIDTAWGFTGNKTTPGRQKDDHGNERKQAQIMYGTAGPNRPQQ